MQEKITYKKFEKERVDFYLASVYKDYSRSYFQKLTNKQKIFVNGKLVLVSHKLKRGDVISFEFEQEEKLRIKPEKIKLTSWIQIPFSKLFKSNLKALLIP